MFLPLKDLNPTRTKPFVTVALIAANALVFLQEMGMGPYLLEDFIRQWGMTPWFLTASLSGPGGHLPANLWLTPLTCLFLHGSLMHLLGNMLFLWIYGNNVEDRLGHFGYAVFYLASGLTGSLAHYLLNPQSEIPVVGASGAISGVMGAYLILWPRAQVMSLIIFFYFIRVVFIPAGMVLGLWIVFQVLNALASSSAEIGGVAWYAHIGGFALGMGVGVIAKTLGGKRRRRG